MPTATGLGFEMVTIFGREVVPTGTLPKSLLDGPLTFSKPNPLSLTAFALLLVLSPIANTANRSLWLVVVKRQRHHATGPGAEIRCAVAMRKVFLKVTAGAAADLDG